MKEGDPSGETEALTIGSQSLWVLGLGPGVGWTLQKLGDKEV